MTDYLSCAQTAKLIRAALKRAFPGVRFSIRSNTYSGGASVKVKWTDGPLQRDVEAVAKRFQGGDFDGMIDMAVCRHHYLTPDGMAVMAGTEGTEGSGGTIERVDNPAPPFDARRVRFGADFVFCDRELSEGFRARLLAAWDALTVRERVALCNHAHIRWDETERYPERLAWQISQFV